MSTLGILWAQYGPYHFARVAALQRLHAPAQVHAIELANRTRDYAWARATPGLELHTVCENSAAERLAFSRVFVGVRRKLAALRIDVCFLPSYSPKPSLAALLAAKSLGLKTVMMNETHAGTARAAGWSAWLKRRLIGWFDAALVGGAPHQRYFAAMGLPARRIFTGYDAVDNDYFSGRAAETRAQAAKIRARYELPEHYFLSLGRFVPKKNLGVLIRAYRQYLDASGSKPTHLVMVGSGEEEPKLRALCSELRMPTYDHCTAGPRPSEDPPASLPPGTKPPGVHFYGFRQIEENPIFYALADVFILPSLYEEWGLVVNEALASGLPVMVSRTVGCVEDLLKAGRPEVTDDCLAKLLDRLGQNRDGLRTNGFVFDPLSPRALAQGLLAAESLPEVRSAMGQAGREIVERFSCENFARNARLAAQAALGHGRDRHVRK